MSEQPPFGPFMESKPGAGDGWAYLPAATAGYRWPEPLTMDTQPGDITEALGPDGYPDADVSGIPWGVPREALEWAASEQPYIDALYLGGGLRTRMLENGAFIVDDSAFDSPTTDEEEVVVGEVMEFNRAVWRGFKRGFTAGATAAAVVGLCVAALGRRYDWLA